MSVPSSSTRRSESAPVMSMCRSWRRGCTRRGPGGSSGRPRCQTSGALEFAPMNSGRIEIVEVGPRDGLQSESQVLPTERKVEFIRRLGRRRTQPHRSRELRESETRAADGGRRSGAGRARADRRARVTSVSCSTARVSNAPRPPAALKSAWRSRPARASASATRACSVDEGVEAWLDIATPRAPRASARRSRSRPRSAVRSKARCAVGRVREIAEQARRRRARRNRRRRHHRRRRADAGLGSIGALRASLPRREVCARISTTPATPGSRMPMPPSKRACARSTRAAVASAAVRSRRPRPATFRPKISIYMLHRMGIETGVDLPALLETSRWLQRTSRSPVPGMVVKAGLFPESQA